MAEDIKVTQVCRKYWASCFDVLDSAGDYAWAVKFYANLMDETTRHKAEPILEEYYDGKISNLRESMDNREKQFYAKVTKHNIICKELGLITITKPKVLLDLLLSPSRRRSYREKATRRLKKGIICPIQDFEAKK